MKNIKNLIERTIKNGGVSFNKDLEILENLKGYTISVAKYEYKTSIGNIEEIKENIKEKINIIKDRKNYFIGLWLDNDILYIDINKIETNYTRAMEFAKQQNQIAIYDNIKNKCIEIKKEKNYILYEYLQKIDDILYITEEKNNIKKYLNLRDFEYLKNFIYNSFDEKIEKYFTKNNKNYILIEE